MPPVVPRAVVIDGTRSGASSVQADPRGGLALAAGEVRHGRVHGRTLLGGALPVKKRQRFARERRPAHPRHLLVGHHAGATRARDGPARRLPPTPQLHAGSSARTNGRPPPCAARVPLPARSVMTKRHPGGGEARCSHPSRGAVPAQDFRARQDLAAPLRPRIARNRPICRSERYVPRFSVVGERRPWPVPASSMNGIAAGGRRSVDVTAGGTAPRRSRPTSLSSRTSG